MPQDHAMGKKKTVSRGPVVIEPRPPLPLEPSPLPPGRFLDCSPPRKTAGIFEVRRGPLESLQTHAAIDEAIHNVARPGGTITGKRKSDAADIWRIPATELAQKIWRESPSLPVAKVVNKPIWKSLPKDKQPPSKRALTKLIKPLKPPQK
jgi:hypothetical protein